MIDVRVILILGVMLLSGGSVSMLIVRLCSPSLKGVGLFSAAFAAGALGAGSLLLAPGSFVSVVVADFALLGSFVLLHLAVLRLATTQPVPVWHGCLLLAFQFVEDLLRLHGVVSGHTRVISVSFLVAIQTATTSAVLWKLSRRSARAPALYSIVLLLSFAAFNGFRGLLLATGYRNRLWTERLSVLAFSLFIAVAIGLAFGFFWMTTAMLTEEAERIASTDPLTRVYNRRVFLKWCEKELLRTQRSGTPFSLLMIDLDHFKQVNDNFGHQRGDEVLCAAVERMQDSVRGIDVLCRWGGEEFAVLLPNAPADATSIVAERIRANIQKMGVLLEREDSSGRAPATLTASIGATTYRDLEDDIASMLLRADRALYQAKGSGRNRILLGA